MDIATVVGIVLCTVLIIVTIFLGGDFMMFINIPSVCTFIGGTIGAGALHFQKHDVAIPQTLECQAHRECRIVFARNPRLTGEEEIRSVGDAGRAETVVLSRPQ